MVYHGIHAMTLLDGIEVREMMAIDDHVRGPTHARNAVRAKADGLVQADPRVEQGDRHDQRIDQWCCKQIGDAALAKEPGDALLESSMRETDLSPETNAAGLNPVTPLVSRAGEFGLEVVLEPRDVFEQIIDTRCHEHSVT